MKNLRRTDMTQRLVNITIFVSIVIGHEYNQEHLRNIVETTWKMKAYSEEAKNVITGLLRGLCWDTYRIGSTQRPTNVPTPIPMTALKLVPFATFSHPRSIPP
jgi:hypothetical protein